MRERRAQDQEPLIELSHCSMILDGQPVLDDVTFTLRAGERWALVGPNGSGKTMLLKLIRGDAWPTPTGRERRVYRLDGLPPGKPARSSLSAVNPHPRFARPFPAGRGEELLSKDRIAFIGAERQDKYVRYGWDLTVEQVVTTGLFGEDMPLTKPRRAQHERVARTMRRFGVWGLRSRSILTLSYGQRRLALLARAFVSGARVLLLDEVFNGLDAKAKDKLRRALEVPRGGHEWVLTSHRSKELPANVTHVARIERGKIVSVCDMRANAPGVRAPTDGGETKARKRPLPVPPARSGGGNAESGAVAFRSVPSLAKRGRDREGARASSRQPSRSAESTALLRISNATLYRDYRPVIRNLNWTVQRGEHWAVLGPNGSGKSTLLSLIHGDLHPALGGTVEREGAPAGTRIEHWKARVGWVSPELQADHYLAKSLEEIVISGRYASVGLNAPPTAAHRRIARRWLAFFGIDDLRDRGPRQVSYGQMRLALLARAMVNDPELLLLDEPCTGLDPDVRAHVLHEIQRVTERGTQLIMAVHDIEDIVPAITKVLRIERGGRVRVSER